MKYASLKKNKIRSKKHNPRQAIFKTASKQWKKSLSKSTFFSCLAKKKNLSLYQLALASLKKKAL